MERRLLVRYFIFWGFVGIFFYSLFFSSSGINKYSKSKNDIELEFLKISKLENKIENIDKNIKKYTQNGFELERFAREDLLMGEQGETVYLLK